MDSGYFGLLWKNSATPNAEKYSVYYLCQHYQSSCVMSKIKNCPSYTFFENFDLFAITDSDES